MRSDGIGQRLALARQARGLSQRALGLKAGVSPSTVLQLEDAAWNASAMTIEKIANGLDVPPEWLAYGDQPAAPGTLAERLKLVREEQGLSLRGIGEKSGVDHTVYRHIEIGNTLNPGVETVNALATALDVSPAWLAFGLGPKSLPPSTT